MEIQYFTECIIYTLISRYMAVICIRITCIADVMLGNCKKCILQCKKEAEEKKKKNAFSKERFGFSKFRGLVSLYLLQY